RLLHGYKASVRLGFAALLLSVSIPVIIAASAGGDRGSSQSDTPEVVVLPEPPPDDIALMGTRSGISVLGSAGGARKLWSGAEVRELVPGTAAWFAHSGAAILHSVDGRIGETRNEGLPVKTIKVLKDGIKGFEQQVQELKDLAV